MAIDTLHPDVSATSDAWTACQDCYAGNRKVKEKGTDYLPYLTSNQDTAEYNSYKSRAHFYDATRRTVEGLVGAALFKAPTIELPDTLSTLITVHFERCLMSGHQGE